MMTISGVNIATMKTMNKITMAASTVALMINFLVYSWSAILSTSRLICGSTMILHRVAVSAVTISMPTRMASVRSSRCGNKPTLFVWPCCYHNSGLLSAPTQCDLPAIGSISSLTKDCASQPSGIVNVNGAGTIFSVTTPNPTLE